MHLGSQSDASYIAGAGTLTNSMVETPGLRPPLWRGFSLATHRLSDVGNSEPRNEPPSASFVESLTGHRAASWPPRAHVWVCQDAPNQEGKL
jgi:hypothetical protein